MIKISELRIGNFIYWNIPEKINVVHTIKGITEKRPQTVPISLGDSYEEYSGIPITEEWLMKFGCNPQEITHFKFNYWNKEKDFSVDVELNGHERFFYYLLHNQDRRKTLVYIHQLQNLYFALTGEELTTRL